MLKYDDKLVSRIRIVEFFTASLRNKSIKMKQKLIEKEFFYYNFTFTYCAINFYYFKFVGCQSRSYGPLTLF